MPRPVDYYSNQSNIPQTGSDNVTLREQGLYKLNSTQTAPGKDNKSAIFDHGGFVFFGVVLAVFIILIIIKKFMFKNFKVQNPGKIIEILAITIYTAINLYMISKYIFIGSVWPLFLAEKSGIIVLAIFLSLFLNCCMVVYSARWKKDKVND